VSYVRLLLARLGFERHDVRAIMAEPMRGYFLRACAPRPERRSVRTLAERELRADTPPP